MKPLQFSIYKGIQGTHGAVQFNLSPPHYYLSRDGNIIDRTETGKDRNEDSIFEVADGKRKLKDGWKVREGCVFMDITSADGPNSYNWKQKIVMALSNVDLGKIIYYLIFGHDPKNESNKVLSLFHDPGMKSETQGDKKKILNVSSPNGTKNGVMISMMEQKQGEKITHIVPLSGDEVVVLKELFQTAISKSLSW